MNRPDDDRTAAGPETQLGRVADEFAERVRRGERPDVEEFARAHPEIADVLRDLLPALCSPTEDGPLGPTPVPAALGEYRILREIGRGGMGVVYEAVQESLGRQVALKVLPPQAVADPVRRERFRREARAAGRLHHTNIVPVFGVGEHGGLHYYAMQYVPARGLDAALRALGGPPPSRSPTGDPTEPSADCGLDELGSQSAIPNPPLPGPDREGAEHYRRVARIGVQAAEALAYAHAHGVIHRDVKPANLLLDAGGTVWVTDFGLAKTADPDLTRSGDVVGTLRYMPPEQFRGEYSQRGDVYSLGLTLYELAALRPAFDAPDWHRLADQIARREPVPPRRLDRRVPRDLETIILRAAAKEPDRRYGTAAELADDLRRFLADEPVLARRLGPWGHVARWCRRNPAVAGLSGLAAALILVGFALVFWQWRRAERTLVQVAAQRQRAEANFAWARTAVDELLSAVGEEMADVPRLGAVRRRLLEKALALHQEFLRERANDPDVRLEAARAHWRMGEIYRLLGPDRNAEAAESFTAALDLLAAPPADPAEEAAYRLERGKALLQLGDLRRSQVDLAAAEQSYRRAAEALVGTPGDGPRLAAEAQRLLGLVLVRQGRFDEAEAAHRRARDELDALRAADPADPLRRLSLAHAHNGLGAVLRTRGRADEAADCFRRAVALERGLITEFPQSRQYRVSLGTSLQNLGNLLYAGGQFPDAAESYGESLALYRRLAEDFPDVPAHRAEEARLLLRLGAGHRRANDGRRAEQEYRAAVALWKGLIDRHGADPDYRRELARGYNLLGNLVKARDPAEAEQLFRDALELYDGLVRDFPDQPGYHSGTGLTLSYLAEQRSRRGDKTGAMELERRALGHHRKAFGFNPRNPDYRRYLRTDCLINAGLMLELGDHRGAAAAAKEAAGLAPDLAAVQVQAAQLLSKCLDRAADEPDVAEGERRHAGRGYAVEAARLYCRAADRSAADPAAPEAKRREVTETCHRHAMTLLRRAVELGLDDPAALGDDAFAALRDRPAFAALLAQLSAAPKGATR
jgi:serine/threonine protein kinase/tetratricopeptide (TPR) repeat protein